MRKIYLYNCLRQCVISDIALHPSLNQEQFLRVFEIHSLNICIRIFGSVMAKLSVACGNENISEWA